MRNLRYHGCAPWLSVNSGDFSIGSGSSGHRGLKEPIEQQASLCGVAPVEMKHEFIQVSLEMLGLDTAWIGAVEPPLDQGKQPLNPEQQHVGGLPGSPDAVRRMPETHRLTRRAAAS